MTAKEFRGAYKFSGVVPPKMIFTITPDCINFESINAGDDELCAVLYTVLHMFCETAINNKIPRKEITKGITNIINEIINTFFENEVAKIEEV